MKFHKALRLAQEIAYDSEYYVYITTTSHIRARGGYTELSSCVGGGLRTHTQAEL